MGSIRLVTVDTLKKTFDSICGLHEILLFPKILIFNYFHEDLRYTCFQSRLLAVPLCAVKRYWQTEKKLRCRKNFRRLLLKLERKINSVPFDFHSHLSSNQSSFDVSLNLKSPFRD